MDREVPPTDATASRKRFRPRANYFLPGDVVWIRPARLPYWPAEVIESDEGANIVRARLLDAPSAELLQPNVEEEGRKWKAIMKQRAKAAEKQHKHNTEKKKGASSSSSVAMPAERQEVATSFGSGAAPPMEADVISSNGNLVYFFDKLTTPEEVEACMEHRLQRAKHDVSAYEAQLYKATLHANRLVRIALSPELLQPYQVCGVGIVHSLMRSHVAAPRQPSTGRFEPQTAVICLRAGMENAARDLQGFDYIWVLFQFSYAAAMATGTGQACIEKLRNDGEDASTATVGEITLPQSSTVSAEEKHAVEHDPLTAYRRRTGVANSAGFKTMVVPPRDDQLRGVFATRSPHRPNFIGISCVRLVAVRGRDVHIADHDLLHGTPVLDIKPYLPFCDAHPDAKAGWVTELDASGRGKADHKFEDQLTRIDRVVE